MASHDHAAMKRQSSRDHSSKVRHLAGGGDVGDDKAMIMSAIGQHEAHDHKGSKKTKLKLKNGGNVEGEAGKRRLDRPGRKKRDAGGPLPGAPMPTPSPAGMAGPGAAMGAQMSPQQLQMLIAQKMAGAGPAGAAGPMGGPPPQPQKRGGATKREAHAEGGKVGKGKKGGTTVNVIIAGGGGDKGGPPSGPPMPPMGMKPPMPPMPPPKPPGPPMGGPPPGLGAPPGPPPGMHAAGGRIGRASGGGIAHAASGGIGRLEKIKSYGANSSKGTNTIKPQESENKNNTTTTEGKATPAPPKL